MNPIAEDISRYIGCSEWDEEQLAHYGMPRRSGRYPWGSGDNPYQHGEDFLSRVEKLKKEGWQETPENIMKEFGLTTTKYRMEKSICKDERRLYDVERAKSLKKDGLGPTEIGKIMGINESSVRSLLLELPLWHQNVLRNLLQKQIPLFLQKSFHRYFQNHKPKIIHKTALEFRHLAQSFLLF